MEVTVEELNKIINGTVEGDRSTVIEGFSPIEEADEGSLTFLSNPKYATHLYSTNASAVLVDKNFKPERQVKPTVIYVQDVYSTLSTLMETFNNEDDHKYGIEPYAQIASTADIPDNVFIGSFAYIGDNVKLGNNVKIYPHSVIHDNCIIGDHTVVDSGVKLYRDTFVGKHCILHSGVVLGSDGFGFAPQKNGSYKKMPQTGNVVIEDHVEIGANTTIDRATIRSTIIRRGVKMDNLIQVAHNVEIGENTAIAAQTGISGSAKIGKNCIIGGQVGIVGHISIADGSQIGAQSGVHNSIKEENQQWFGAPVAPIKTAIKSGVLLKKLPDIYDRLKKLEETVREFKSKRSKSS